MSRSYKEELIGLLWWILAILCYQNNCTGSAIIAVVLGLMAMIASVYYALKDGGRFP